MLGANAELERKLVALEKKYDMKFRVAFDAIPELMAPSVGPQKRRIPFRLRRPMALAGTSEDRR